MALTRIGLGGILTFDEKPAVKGIRRARDEFGRFVRNTNTVTPRLNRMSMAMRSVGRSARLMGRGLNMVGMGLGRMAVGGLAFTALLGKGAKQAATFEQSIADLGAVARASDEDMTRLTKKAKKMGIVTAFSASESAQAMEMMARAGATVDEQIGGVRGVLDAAAAGNLHYAETAEIISTITKGMGREFARASNLADILSLASTKSNVTIQSLGETFKLGMAQARVMGIRTEELAAIFGKLGDAGLTGSMGGTSFSQMLIKLAKPSRTGTKLMKEWGISLTDASGKMKPISSIVQDFSKRLGSIRDAALRARVMTELFSVRGQRAYSALASAGKKGLDKLTRELENASGGLGAATDIAQRRLNTIKGAFKLLGASVEGVSIEMFGPLIGSMQEYVKDATQGLNNVLGALELVSSAEGDVTKNQKLMTDAQEKYGKTAVAVALGLSDVIDFLKESWEGFVGLIKSTGDWFKKSFGETGVRSLVAVAGKIVAVMAVAAPFLLLLKGIMWTFGGLIPIVKGLGLIMAGAFGPVTIIVGGIILLMSLFVDSVEEVDAATGKSTTKWKIFGEDVGRVLGGVKAALVEVWNFLVKINNFLDSVVSAGIGDLAAQLEAAAAKKKGLESKSRAAGVAAGLAAAVTPAAAPITPIARGAGKIATEIARNADKAAKITKDTAAQAAKKAEESRKKFLAELARQRGEKPAIDVNVRSILNLDGKQISKSVARTQKEIQERSLRSTPWPTQQRLTLEQGAIPAPAGGRNY